MTAPSDGPVHLLVPAGFTTQPSGGNVYDRHLATGLVARGWPLVIDEVSSAAEVGHVLAAVPHGTLVMVDSLVASWSAEVLLGSDARVVPLVHMLFGAPQEGELLVEAPVVITTSRWTRDRLVAEHAVDPRHVQVATPGVDRARPAPGSRSGSELLCVAALTPAKGHDVLLDALARVTDLEWRCTLVGSVQAEPTLVDSLRKQAADRGITERLHFAGELVGEDLATAYGRADLLVLASRAETYGMVITEALAHGLPVLATAVGGVPEALCDIAGHSRPGMLVRPGDPEVLARALRRWLEDEPLRRWLRQAAAERLPTLPTWSRTSAIVAAALEAVR